MSVHQSPIRNDIIKFWSDVLRDASGYDWLDASRVIQEKGNQPGIYPDTLMVLYKLITKYNIKKIVEFGSGASTLFFQTIANLYSIDFISYEEYAQWADITRSLLSHYNLSANIQPLSLSLDENLFGDADLVFLDHSGSGREKCLSVQSDWLKSARFVVLDDAHVFSSTGTLANFMIKTNRCKFFTFNGGGRMDRVEFISYLDGIGPDPTGYIAQELAYF